MLVPQNVYNLLKDDGFEFFTGMSDSLLKDFCAYIVDHSTHHEHLIAANRDLFMKRLGADHGSK
jgi:phosphonopyruvate decarboxylase